MGIAKTEIELDAAMISRIQQVYRSDCRLVRGARLRFPTGETRPEPSTADTWVVCNADCRSPGAWYAGESGHLNAIDFNLVYNQVMFCLVAGIVAQGLIPELKHWDLAEFWRRQAPDVLITDYHARFKKPVRASETFQCTVDLREVMPDVAKHILYLRTGSSLSGVHGGYFEADVLLAITQWTVEE